nr:hypothetical protein [Lachnospiraceae bacterium]
IPGTENIEFKGTSEDQVAKIKEIYDNIEAPEDKIEFLLKIDAYYANKSAILISRPEKAKENDTPKYIYSNIQNLKNDFIKTYVKGKSMKELDKLTERIHILKLKSVMDIKADYDKMYNSLPATEDPKVKHKKAQYYAKLNHLNNSLYTTISQFDSLDLSEHLTDGDAMIDYLYNECDVTNRTKMSKLAKYMKLKTPEEVQNFYNEYNANPDSRVFDIYKNRLFAQNKNENPEMSDEDIMSIVDRDLMYTISNSIKIKMIDAKKARFEKDLYKKVGITKEYFNTNGFKLSELSADTSDSGIEDWVKNEGDPLLNAQMEDDMAGFMKQINRQYVLPLEKRKEDKLLKANSANRIRRATADSYGWFTNIERDEQGTIVVNNIEGNPELTQGLKELKYDCNDDIGYDPEVKFAVKSHRITLKHNMDKIKNVIALPRGTTILSMFTIWALGTYPGADMTNFTELTDNKDLIHKFAQFCEKNPTVTAKNEQEFRKSVQAWNEVFLNATEKVKKYKFPEINYDKPAEVRKVADELSMLVLMSQDFNQEKDRIFNNNLGLHGMQIMEDYMGSNKWDSLMSTWLEINNIMLPYNSAYNRQIQGSATNNVLGSVVSLASNRALAATLYNKCGGKDLNSVIKEKGSISHIYQKSTNTYLNLYDYECELSDDYKSFPEIERKVFIKYLNGKDIKTLKKKLKVYEEKNIKDSKKEINSVCISSLGQGFQSDLNMDVLKNTLLNLNNDAQSVIDFVQSKENMPGKNVTGSTLVSKTVNGFMDIRYRSMLYKAGIEKKDALLIDGKTIDEMWGKKYKNVTDPVLREHCYQVELLKKIAEGNSIISARNINYSPSNKFRYAGDVLVSLPAEKMKDIKHNLDVYVAGTKDMLTKLKEAQSALLTTHPNYNANNERAAKREIGNVGSDLFQNMETALADCINAIEKNNVQGPTPEVVIEKLNKLKNASETYFDKRNTVYSMFFGKSEKSGTERLKQSNILRKALPDMITDYAMLRQGIDEKLICSGGNTFDKANIGHIKMSLDKMKNVKVDTYGLREMPQIAENELKTEYNNRKTVSAALKDGLKRLGRNLDELMVHKGEMDAYDAALAFQAKNYMEKMQVRNFTPEQINTMKTEIEQKFADNTFKRDAEKLAKNPVFKAFVKENKGLDFKEWRDIEKDSKKLNDSYIMDIKFMKGNVNAIGNNPAGANGANAANAGAANGANAANAGAANGANAANAANAAAVGVANGANAANAGAANGANAAAVNGANAVNAAAVKKAEATCVAKYILTGSPTAKLGSASKTSNTMRYKRLGEYISKTILTKPTSKVMLDAIACGKLKYEKVEKSVIDIFKSKKMFADNKYNEDEIRRKIESGEFVNTVEKTLIKQAENSANAVVQKIPQREIRNIQINQNGVQGPAAGQGQQAQNPQAGGQGPAM